MEEDESCYPVTVETKNVSVGDEGVYLLNHVQINTISHCIFCLNKTAKSSVSLKQPAANHTGTGGDNVPQQTVPRANLNLSCAPSSQSQFLSTFNQTWKYLQKRYKNNGPDPSSFLESIQSREEDAKKKNSMTFLDIPIMCILCAENMEAISILFEDLTAQLNVLGKIMQDSKDCGNYQQFESSLKSSNLEGGVIAATIKLLNHLGEELEMMNDFHSDDESNEEGMEAERDPLADIDATVNPAAGMESQAGSMPPEGSRYPKRQLVVEKADYKSEEASTSDDDDFADVDDRNDTDTQPELYCKSELEDSSSSEDSQETRTRTLPRILRRQTLASPTRKKKKIAPPTYNERIESSYDKTCSEEPVNVEESSLQDQIKKNRKLFSMAFVPCLGRSQFICQVDKCGESFADLDVLWKHQAKSHRPKTQASNNCNVCGRSFDCARDLQLHKRRVHVVARGSTQTYNERIENLKSSRVETPSKEPINAKQSSTLPEQMNKNKLLFSTTFNPSVGTDQFTCQVVACGESFTNLSNLWDHQITAHRTKNSALQCDVCGESFDRRRRLESHKRTAHIQPTQMCDICKVQVAATEIYEHVRAHIGQEYIIKCPNPKCTHVSSNPRSVYKHFKSDALASRCDISPGAAQEFLDSFNLCQQCGHKEANTFGLRCHLRRVHETSTKNFSCPIENCPQKFTVRQSVALHIFQHDMRSAFDKQSCDVCNRNIKLKEMEKHLKEGHHVEQIIKCNQCPFLFSSRELLVEHLYDHRFGVLSCDLCGDQVKFSRHAQLRLHYWNLHKIGTEYKCQYCGQVNLSRKLWMTHTSKHLKGNEKGEDGAATSGNKIIKCDVCDFECASEYRLKDHKIQEHGAALYSCRFCTATLTTHSKLSVHERKHKMGSYQEEFRCEVQGCGKAYKVRTHLKRHIAKAHLGEKPHVCQICIPHKAYATAVGLDSHNTTIHLGLRAFVCDECGETFTSGTSVRRHKLIHTGERPFVCEVCGQRFRHKEVLKTHVEGHQKKGADFKPNGPMKQIRKRVEKKS